MLWSLISHTASVVAFQAVTVTQQQKPAVNTQVDLLAQQGISSCPILQYIQHIYLCLLIFICAIQSHVKRPIFIWTFFPLYTVSHHPTCTSLAWLTETQPFALYFKIVVIYRSCSKFKTACSVLLEFCRLSLNRRGLGGKVWGGMSLYDFLVHILYCSRDRFGDRALYFLSSSHTWVHHVSSRIWCSFVELY